jgi:subtilisin
MQQSDRSPFPALQRLGFRAAILGPTVALKPLDFIYIYEGDHKGDASHMVAWPLEMLAASKVGSRPVLYNSVVAPDIEAEFTGIFEPPASVLMLEALALASGNDPRLLSAEWLRDGAIRLRFRKVTADCVDFEQARDYLGEIQRIRYRNDDLWPSAVVLEVLQVSEVEVEFFNQKRERMLNCDSVAFVRRLSGWSVSRRGILIHPAEPVTIGFRIATKHGESYEWQGGELLAVHPALSLDDGFSLLSLGTLVTERGPGTVIRRGSPTVSSRRSRSGLMDFVILPLEGLSVEESPDFRGDRRAFEVFGQLENLPRGEEARVRFEHEQTAFELTVIDSTGLLGPKWVRMTQDTVARLRDAALPLRIEPLRNYRLTAAPRFNLVKSPGHPLASVRVVCSKTGQPIEGAKVIAITDWQRRIGSEAMSDANGFAQLDLGALPAAVDRLYIVPTQAMFWGAYAEKIALTGQLALEPVDLATVRDGLRYHYGELKISPTDGSGVKVGIIDSGIGPHPELKIVGGCNVVTGELRTDFLDNGLGHGTHVAGIISSRNATVWGLAQGAELYSYRIFPMNTEKTNNFYIIAAVIRAIDDQCEVINLSVTAETEAEDPALRTAIEQCAKEGAVLVVAAGNEGGSRLSLLARYAASCGFVVTAVGRQGTYPAGSIEASDDSHVYGLDPCDFFAEFSNAGSGVSFTAPGVGILSTAPGGGYCPKSGTSMAAPAVSGVTARVISRCASFLPPDRNETRVLQIMEAVRKTSRPMGFSFAREGDGLPVA